MSDWQVSEFESYCSMMTITPFTRPKRENLKPCGQLCVLRTVKYSLIVYTMFCFSLCFSLFIQVFEFSIRRAVVQMDHFGRTSNHSSIDWHSLTFFSGSLIQIKLSFCLTNKNKIKSTWKQNKFFLFSCAMLIKWKWKKNQRTDEEREEKSLRKWHLIDFIAKENKKKIFFFLTVKLSVCSTTESSRVWDGTSRSPFTVALPTDLYCTVSIEQKKLFLSRFRQWSFQSSQQEVKC